MMHEFEVCFRIENKSNQVIKAAAIFTIDGAYVAKNDVEELIGFFTTNDVVSITRLD